MLIPAVPLRWLVQYFNTCCTFKVAGPVFKGRFRKQGLPFVYLTLYRDDK